MSEKNKEKDLKIIILEDDLTITAFLEYNLQKAGFRTLSFSYGAQMIDYLKNNTADMAIVDWMLPGTSGIDICSEIRESYKNKSFKFNNSLIPIILVTAKSNENDKILAFEKGADDYISKPFSVKELIARIKAINRRNRFTEKGILIFDDIIMNVDAMCVHRNNRELKLGLREFSILKYLMTNPEKVKTREEIIKNVWGNTNVNQRTVDVNINRLRSELFNKDSDVYQPLHTIRSIGYSLKVKVNRTKLTSKLHSFIDSNT